MLRQLIVELELELKKKKKGRMCFRIDLNYQV
jgi:hypothetical protein